MLVKFKDFYLISSGANLLDGSWNLTLTGYYVD